jgi:hypothetical protein
MRPQTAERAYSLVRNAFIRGRRSRSEFAHLPCAGAKACSAAIGTLSGCHGLGIAAAPRRRSCGSPEVRITGSSAVHNTGKLSSSSAASRLRRSASSSTIKTARLCCTLPHRPAPPLSFRSNRHPIGAQAPPAVPRAGTKPRRRMFTVSRPQVSAGVASCGRAVRSSAS